MARRDFAATADGVHLAGWVAGSGPRVLVLHGGPGLGSEYLDPLADELARQFTVASYQQRGLPPSQEEGPFTIADHVEDVRRVMDALGWADAVLMGHSWGGHLALHAAVALPGRWTGLLLVDILGGVGDGGEAEFEAEMARRTPPEDLARAAELDARTMAGEGTEDDAVEGLRLFWPAYFASREAAPPMPATRLSVACYAETFESLHEELPRLEKRLGDVRVPTAFLVGAGSPMPRSASTDTAARVPGAVVEVVEGAGHFPWHERPGCVRRALARLVGGAGSS